MATDNVENLAHDARLIHQLDHSPHYILDIAKASRLLPIAIDKQ
jgi:hypothetical protein